jgi:hypothetical protein
MFNGRVKSIYNPLKVLFPIVSGAFYPLGPQPGLCLQRPPDTSPKISFYIIPTLAIPLQKGVFMGQPNHIMLSIYKSLYSPRMRGIVLIYVIIELTCKRRDKF